jgi:hypothetical protein
MIGTAELEARQIFILNFKGTPSQEEDLKQNKLALSDQCDTPVLFSRERYTLCGSKSDFPKPANPGQYILY